MPPNGQHQPRGGELKTLSLGRLAGIARNPGGRRVSAVGCNPLFGGDAADLSCRKFIDSSVIQIEEMTLSET